MTLTPAQHRLLQRIAQAETDGTPLHVYRDLARPGNGIHPTTIDALFRAALVTLGPFVPLRGRPLTLTDAGRAALASATPAPADELRAAAARLRAFAASDEPVALCYDCGGGEPETRKPRPTHTPQKPHRRP